MFEQVLIYLYHYFYIIVNQIIQICSNNCALMEIDEGTVTGSYCTVAPGQIPLFYSKNMADTYLSLRYDKIKLVVRGISQYQLRILLELAEETCQKLVLFPTPFATSQDLDFYQAIVVEPKAIKTDFLI